MARKKAARVRTVSLQSYLPLLFSALIGLCIAFLALFLAIISVMQTGALYKHLTTAQVQQNVAILTYINGHDADLGFLSPSERAHMQDVQRLFSLGWMLTWCSLGILLGMFGYFVFVKQWASLDELLARSLRYAGWTIIGLCALLGLIALFGFETFWVLFHLVLFPQGNWMFSPDSVLITLYPSAFFESFVIRWFIDMTIFAFACLGLSFVMTKMRYAEVEFKSRK